MKVQLSLSIQYVPEWDAFAAVREVVQNGLDGETDGYKLTVEHSGSTLRVSNVGAKLDTKVWLLGQSGKRDGGDYRGQHGEGLKLASLVLARRGHDVKIVNGDESWTPKIEASDQFAGAEVLTIYTHKRQNDSGAFTVEIGNITKEAWALMKERFLFLNKPEKAIDTNYANVLMDEKFKGQVFVKGIWVQTNPDFRYGYDFKSIHTDRDRRMVSSWDMKYYAAKALEEAMTSNYLPAETVVDLLASQSHDAQDLASSYSTNTEVAAKVAAVFKARHGDSAIPVSSMAEAREVEHFGKKGVVVQQALVDVLRKNKEMHIDHVRTEAGNSVKHIYSWSDLSGEEKDTYREVVGLVEKAASELNFGKVEDRLTIVDFGDAALDGLFKSGSIQVAKRLLTDYEEFLATLVHEVAHAAGGDGSVGHERAEGKLFSRIVRGLTKD
jgi:hypothetical protein